MLRTLRSHLTYANVMATIAVFLGLGGSAYAINEWNSSNIQDNTLTGADIKGKASPGFVDGSLDTYDIRNKGLLSSDVATNTLTAGELAPNSASTSEIKDGSVTKAKLAPLGAWSPLAFNVCGQDDEGIVDFNWSSVPDYASGAARLDAHGVVHLRGAVQCLAGIFNNPIIANLPAGSRPTAKERFAVASSEEFDGSGVNRGAAIVEISPGGQVRVGGDFHRAFISLSGIEFDALN